MGLEKRAPRHSSVRSSLDAMVVQDPLDGVPGNYVSKLSQGTDDSGVSPAVVVFGHSYDQLFDVLFGLGSPNGTFLAPVVFLRDQPLVPALKGIWRNEGAELLEQFAAKSLGFRGKSTSLRFGEPESSFATDLFEEDAPLFKQVLNYRLLLPVDPASEHQEEEPPRHWDHRPILVGPRNTPDRSRDKSRITITRYRAVFLSIVFSHRTG
jgi:hypothetical protein